MKKSVLFFFLFFSLISFSQNEKHFYYSDERLNKVLSDIESNFDVKFSFDDTLVKTKKLSIKEKNYSLNTIMLEIESQIHCSFEQISKRYYALVFDDDIDFQAEVNSIDEVVIHGYLTEGITKNKDNNYQISPNNLEILPGLTEPDVLQTLQQLPGVISPNETATGLNVRGGTPDQNLILWNDIPIYHNGHLFGMISGFNPNIIKSVKFCNKGTNSKYGGRISSVIDITTDNKIAKSTKVGAGVNSLSTDVNLKMPLLNNKLGIELAARRSFTDIIPSFTYRQMADKVFQNTEIIDNDSNTFYFQDYNARINYKMSEKDYFSLSAILIDNDLDNEYANDDTTVNNLMSIGNSGFNFKWKHDWNSKLISYISTNYSAYEFNYDNTDTYVDTDFETTEKKNRVLYSGIRAHTEFIPNNKSKMDMGYQLAAYDVSYLYTIKTPSLNYVLESNRSFIKKHAIYISYDYEYNDRLNFQLGSRYNYYSELKKHNFEPRFIVNYKVVKNLDFSITGEIKHQVINQINETVVSNLNLENQLWILSDDNERPILKGQQITTGFIYKNNNWVIDIDAYLKTTDGLTTLTYGFLNPLDPSLHFGDSKSKGLDLYIKKHIKAFDAWVTYSYNTTENKFDGINEGKYFAFNAEIKHAANLSVSYKFDKLQVAMGWYWHSGRPYSLIDFDTKEYISINKEHLLNYHHLDISAYRNFDFSKNKKIKGKIGLSLYNIYNQKNILNKEYDLNVGTGNDEIQVKDKYSLLFTPNVFCRLNF